jgi:hypothetical protein
MSVAEAEMQSVLVSSHHYHPLTRQMILLLLILHLLLVNHFQMFPIRHPRPIHHHRRRRNRRQSLRPNYRQTQIPSRSPLNFGLRTMLRVDRMLIRSQYWNLRYSAHPDLQIVLER